MSTFPEFKPEFYVMTPEEAEWYRQNQPTIDPETGTYARGTIVYVVVDPPKDSGEPDQR